MNQLRLPHLVLVWLILSSVLIPAPLRAQGEEPAPSESGHEIGEETQQTEIPASEPDPFLKEGEALEFPPTATEPKKPPPPAEPETSQQPDYIRFFVKARDLMLNRQYEEAGKVLSQYGVEHPDEPIKAVGEALLELLALAELRDYRRTQRLDAVFTRARIAAHSWIARSPDPVFATMLAGTADALDAVWLLRTGSKLSGLRLGFSALGLIEDATDAPNPSKDAQGFYAMYLYMRGRYGSRYLPFVQDTRNVGRAGAERCVEEAPTMGPLCHLFLLYVAKWERRWEDLNRLGNDFREHYPASMFAALIQAEGLLVAQRPEEALNVLLEVGQYDPNFALHHLWMGRVYWEGLHQPLPAEEFVNHALEVGLNQRSRISEAHTVLGEIAMENGYFAEAKIRLDWALEFDSGNKRAEIAEDRLEELMKK